MKSYYIAVSLALFLFMNGGCQCKKTSDARIRRPIIVGTNATYPPYESINANGEMEGFDIDIAHAIGKELGRPIEIHEMGFDALILGLKQGKIDLAISGISITQARQKEIRMVPYQGSPVRSFALLFWEKVPEGFVSVNQLTGKVLCVQSGTVMEQLASKLPGVIIKPLESTAELIMDIQHGKSQVAWVEPHVAAEVMAKFPELKRVEMPLDRKDWVEGNGIGINKDNPALYDVILGTVIKLRNSGTIQELEKKWFKGPVS